MVHEVLSVALFLAEADPATVTPAASNDTVTNALIGGAVAILVALIANYFGTRRARDPESDPRAVRDAVLDAAHSENDRRDAETKVDEMTARIAVYEKALTLRGFAYWKFKTGEEPDSDVRIIRHS